MDAGHTAVAAAGKHDRAVVVVAAARGNDAIHQTRGVAERTNVGDGRGRQTRGDAFVERAPLAHTIQLPETETDTENDDDEHPDRADHTRGRDRDGASSRCS